MVKGRWAWLQIQEGYQRKWLLHRENARRAELKLRAVDPEDEGEARRILNRLFEYLREAKHVASKIFLPCPGCGKKPDREYGHTEVMMNGMPRNYCVTCTGTHRACAQCGTFYEIAGHPLNLHSSSYTPIGQAYLREDEECPQCGSPYWLGNRHTRPMRNIGPEYGKRCPSP